jgi:cytosine permease
MRDVLWVQLGMFTAMSQFVLGAALGYGMSFWNAFWAIVIGSALLASVALATGLAGAWEGLPSGLLSRWSGFGKYGSGLMSIVIVVGDMAWFGVQNSIFAEAVNRATRGLLGLALSSVLTGLSVTLIAIFGFRWLARTASLTVPAFVFVISYGIYHVFGTRSVLELVQLPSPGAELPLFTGVTMVAGGFMLGAVIAPDITRFCRSGGDVFWATIISTFLGELGIGLAGVLMAHVARTSDVVSILYAVSGWLGVTVAILATIKLNDVALYGSSLHLTNVLQALFGWRLSRAAATAALGAIGILFSICGILTHFVGFLLILGKAMPPVAGVFIVDYFILKSDRAALEASRQALALPTSCEWINPVAILAWIAGFLAVYKFPGGIPSLTSLLASAIFYYVGMKLPRFWAKQSVKPLANSPG